MNDRKDWLNRAMEDRKWRKQQGLSEVIELAQDGCSTECTSVRSHHFSKYQSFNSRVIMYCNMVWNILWVGGMKLFFFLFFVRFTYMKKTQRQFPTQTLSTKSWFCSQMQTTKDQFLVWWMVSNMELIIRIMYTLQGWHLVKEQI